MRDKGVLQSVGFEEHPVAERALLVADQSVQRMADIVQNIQQFVGCSPLCHCHRVQLHADHRAGPPDQFIQSGGVPLVYAASPAHHSVEEDACNHRLVKQFWV